jgi:hypothetical protein
MHNVDNDNLCNLLIDANKYSAKWAEEILLELPYQELLGSTVRPKAFEELEFYPSLLMEVTKLVFSNVNAKEIAQWNLLFFNIY